MLAEAIVCGRPVIASNIWSIAEVINRGVNGVLIRPGDFAELSRQIEILLNDSRCSRMLGQNARQKSSHEFDLDRMVDNTLKAFELAIEQTMG